MGVTQSTSKFGRYSTSDDVVAGVDMSGKNVIVTGSRTGIGLETVRALAKCGAFVVMACRQLDEAQKAVEVIKEETPNVQITIMELDLASLTSVRKFAADFIALNRPLHVLINNAGVMACPYKKTEDGFEMQIGTNHLGHFLLTNLLIPRLKEGTPSRVINISSTGHQIAGMNWGDLHFEKSVYSAWRAYGQSKTANILFTMELNKRYASQGIHSNAVHPGVIGATELARHMWVTMLPGRMVIQNAAEWAGILKTIPQGAATQLYVATAAELEGAGGLYFSDCTVTQASAHATNPESAERLWVESTKLVGLEVQGVGE